LLKYFIAQALGDENYSFAVSALKYADSVTQTKRQCVSDLR